MWLTTLRDRYRHAPQGARLGFTVVIALLLGLVALPAMTYVAGSTLLGRYEGASVANLYGSVYRGLGTGNASSWIVVLGPALLYFLSLVLLRWWQMGDNP